MMKRFIICMLAAFLPLTASAFDTKAKQAYLLDVQTGAVLLEKSANEPMIPSSMTKLMTLYILFDAIESGKIGLEDTLRVSEKAWRKGGSKMFVEVGKQVKVEDLIRGIVIQSGNDACIVVAEGLAGTEEAFAERMNEYAKRMGLEHTNLLNATGWPDEGHTMSAKDLGILGQRLLGDFPKFMPYFLETEFTFSGIRQPNRNPLLGSDLGVNGLKTGHTEAAGYGIVFSATQEERTLVAVLNGMGSERERKEEGEKLLRYGFNFYDNIVYEQAFTAVDQAPVIDGEPNVVDVMLAEPALVTVPKGKENALQADIILFSEPLIAPLPEGTLVGTYNVTLNGQTLSEIPLITAQEVPRAGFFKRHWDALMRKF